MNNLKFLKLIKIILISFGVIDSFYLLLETYFTQTSFCPLNGCTNNLVYGNINIPALLGLIWFSAYPFLSGKFLSFWQIAALVGVIFLAFYAVVTSYYCPFCFSAYAAGIGLIIVDRRLKIKNTYQKQKNQIN
ncbi:hypothetical protein DRP05_09630 [Archaeoglobales archaeon]|nr:MAG: hypothetical protein DRP05_09630 [Archaeoglobales archaeon]